MSESSLNLPVIWKWGKRVGYSVLDQGLYSGSHFLLNLLLARWLSPEEYGAFAISFSVYLFLSGFNYAFILDPMAVFGPLVQISQQSIYVKRTFVLQLGLSVFLSLIVCLVGLATSKTVSSALIGIGLSLPFLLSALFLRNSFYIQSETEKSALVSSVYFVTIIGAIIVTGIKGTITLVSAFWILAGGGLAAITVGGFYYIKKSNINIESIHYSEIISRNWGYGKWMGLTALLNGFTTLSFPLLIGVALGLAETAAFRALQNFINPMFQMLAVSVTFFLPILSKKIFEKANITQMITIFFGGPFSVTMIYVVFINFLSKPLIHLILKQDFYLEYSWLIIWFSIYLILVALSTFFSVILRAIKQSKFIYISKMAGVVTFTVLLMVLIIHRSLSLVMLILIIVTAVECGRLARFFLKTRSEMDKGHTVSE